ncbi:hypothetical protein LTR97_008789 [Elasticomyces elasticus]|uniref:F-box domain-containing protein n=1 Tax=Elasticomyces elasticus TaxID=574655 RepID=A0AAN7ZS82_9PEZI|nr:hypothetical protein LTR97_008789 [Elasticomyces elasticus]
MSSSQAPTDSIPLGTAASGALNDGEVAEVMFSLAQTAEVQRMVEAAHREGIEQGRREREQEYAAASLPMRQQKTNTTHEQETASAADEQPSPNTQQLVVQSHRRPAEAVFGVGELFDSILQHLDILHLFANLRICRRWNTSLSNSTVLQQKMFLRTNFITADPSLVRLNPMAYHLIQVHYGMTGGSAWVRPQASWRKMRLVSPALVGHTIETHLCINVCDWVVPFDSFSADERYRGMNLAGLARTLRWVSEQKDYQGQYITDLLVCCVRRGGRDRTTLIEWPLSNVKVPLPPLRPLEPRQRKT